MVLHQGRELGGDAACRQGEVRIEVEVEGRVEEDRLEAGPPRSFSRLGPPASPLPLEPEARDDADDDPALIEQVEQCARAPDRLVVWVRGHVEERGAHEKAG